MFKRPGTSGNHGTSPPGADGEPRMSLKEWLDKAGPEGKALIDAYRK